MAKSNLLTVSYGTFACELEGFDDPFPIMQQVVAFFQDKAENDPEFALYGDMDAIDALVDSVLDVSGAEAVEAMPIDGGVHVRKVDEANATESAGDAATDDADVLSSPIAAAATLAGADADIELDEIEATEEDEADAPVALEDTAEGIEKYEAPQPVEATEVEPEAVEEVAAADDVDIAPIDVDDATADEAADEPVAAAGVDHFEYEAITDEADDFEDGDEDEDVESLEDTFEVAANAADEAQVDQVEEVEPTSDTAEGEADEVLLAAEAETDSLEEFQDEYDKLDDEMEDTADVLRLDIGAREDIAEEPSTFIDKQYADDEDDVSEVEADVASLPDVEPEKDDLANTFADAMRRPTVGKGEEATPAPVVEKSAPLILGGSPSEPSESDVAASAAPASEPKKSGLKLGIPGLKASGLGSLLKSNTDEAKPQAAPLQLTPSLKVPEDADPQKPKSVSETVAERAEENTRRRLRIIRNDEEVAAQPADAEPAQQSAPPIEVQQPSAPEAVEQVEPEVAVAEFQPASEPKPEAPAPIKLEPEVKAAPLQLSEPEPAAPAAPPAAAKPEPAAAKVETAAPEKAAKPSRSGAPNDIADKLNASFASAPEPLKAESIQLNEDEFVDDGEMNFHNFVHRLGASALPELMEAAAVYLVLVENQQTFERKDIMRQVDSVSNGQTFSPQARIKSFGKLVRTGQIMRLDGGAFALAPELQSNYQQQMAL